MSNWMFVAAAFAVTWVALFGYLAHVQRAMRNARALMEHADKAANR